MPEVDLKGWIYFKCLRTLGEQDYDLSHRTIKRWYQMLDKSLLKEIKDWKAAIKDLLLGMRPFCNRLAAYLFGEPLTILAVVPQISSTGHTLQAPCCCRC